jgi:hypothetical protein
VDSGGCEGKGVNVFLGLVLPTILLSTSPTSSPQFVPGEVLAKFAPGTDESAAVSRATQVTPPDLAALVPVISRLQAKTGVPLKATQVLSGGWVRLSIDGDGLTKQLVRQLRMRDTVVEVRVSPGKPGTPVDVSSPTTLLITFSPGSAESKTVEQKLSDPSNLRFGALMRELERDLNLPLKGEVSDDAALLIHVDLNAFTPILADRINALCEIESAQPNYIVTIK